MCQLEDIKKFEIKNMWKHFLLISLLFLAFNNTTYAKVLQEEPNINRNLYTKRPKIKFGSQVGVGAVAGSGQVGVFSEYKYSEAISLQVAISYFMNKYFLSSFNFYQDRSALVQAHYISLPILIRRYVIEQKSNIESGFFFGVQLGYLFNANFQFKEEKFLNTDKFTFMLLDDFKEIESIPLQKVAEQTEVRRFQISFVAGFDFEFKNGLMIGYTYTNDLINIVKANHSRSNWSYQLKFGYNLAKLFV